MFKEVVLTTMPDDIGTDGDPERSSMTRGEQVRAAAARTLRTPRTATWVADETEIPVKTAQKYLDRAAEDNVLRRVEQESKPSTVSTS